MEINSDALFQQLLFSSPVMYDESLTLHPVKMKDVFDFNLYKSSIMVRKNSIFPIKKIIKMTYLDFLFHCHNNMELAKDYEMPLLPYYYVFAFELLKLVFKEQEVLANFSSGGFMINGEEITSEQFDDFRRIIIIQNGLDFDIDEFIHYDTEKELEKAQNSLSKGDEANLEDYVDSVCIMTEKTEEEIMNMSIRKFWRYVKRIRNRDIFITMKSAESSGMVKFDNPIKYWMASIDEDDKYKDIKTDASSIRKLVNGE